MMEVKISLKVMIQVKVRFECCDECVTRVSGHYKLWRDCWGIANRTEVDGRSKLCGEAKIWG